MLKKITLILICLPLLVLMGFDKQNDLVVTNVEVTVIKTERILRYDFRLKYNGLKQLTSTFDYPGHQPRAIEFVVRPNEKLASLMMMDTNSKYKKMDLRGGGGGGTFEPSKELTYHLEYQIKDGVSFEKVKAAALDSTLIILDGTKIIAEIPLS